MTLWYGTPDAPAPIDSREARTGVAVMVGVRPSNPTNTVSVHYRVDGSMVQTVRAVRNTADFAQGTDYFQAVFPEFWSGETVWYVPVLTHAGLRVPRREAEATFASTFRFREAAPVTATGSDQVRSRAGLASVTGAERLPFHLEYLASIRVPLREPELIGETPEGIRVHWFWYPAEGVVVGPNLNAKVRSLGGDWMTIRRDGVGVLDVRATLETSDGALLYVHYPGYFELGENGYQDFLNRRWPRRAPTRTTPRFDVAHPRYRWLNRVQCLGIGEVRMDELVYIYDMYVVS